MFKNFSDVSPDCRTAVWNAGFSDYITPINMSIEQLDNRLKSLNMSPTESKVYFVEEKPAGIYLYAEADLPTEKVSWLGGMSVNPQFRGQQIALKMLEDFQETSIRNGVATMTLEAIDGNDRAIAVYRKFGFQPIKKVSFLNSTESYAGESTMSLEKISDLATLGIVEDDTVAWQNKTLHGYDCLSISDANHDIVGYAVVNQQGPNLVINQLVVKDPKSQVPEVLKGLATKYHPEKWVGSNLETDNEVTQVLINSGFVESVTQHQYIKKV